MFVSYLYRVVCCESSLLELLVLWGPPPSFTGNWNNIIIIIVLFFLFCRAGAKKTKKQQRDRERERKR